MPRPPVAPEMPLLRVGKGYPGFSGQADELVGAAADEGLFGDLSASLTLQLFALTLT